MREGAAPQKKPTGRSRPGKNRAAEDRTLCTSPGLGADGRMARCTPGGRCSAMPRQTHPAAGGHAPVLWPLFINFFII